MIPIRDDQPRYSTPYVNYFVIGLNALVFLLFEPPTQSRAFQLMTLQFGLIPHDFTRALAGSAQYPLGANLLTILTSMFMHGSFFHVLGNMWFLWIFGDNIEDHLGHFSYLIFYLICGIAAALTDIALTPTSNVPMIGASGAIAGVMGAYFVLYPRSRIVALVPLFFWFQIFEVPAILFLGIWFIMQFVSGVGSIVSAGGAPGGGVAFWAHVAGFVAGITGVMLFRRPERERVEWWHDT